MQSVCKPVCPNCGSDELFPHWRAIQDVTAVFCDRCGWESAAYIRACAETPVQEQIPVERPVQEREYLTLKPNANRFGLVHLRLAIADCLIRLSAWVSPVKMERSDNAN